MSVRLPSNIHDALLVLLERLAEEPIVWAITGSLSHALQGVPVTVRDIDVVTDEPGARAIEALFAGHSAEKVAFSSADCVRSHFGMLLLAGTTVEIMGAMEIRPRQGGWEEPVDVAGLRVWIPYGERVVPVLPLAHEIAAYEKMGRTDRAAHIRRHTTGGDHGDHRRARPSLHS